METYEPCTEEGEPIVTKKPRQPSWNWQLATKIADLTISGGWYGGMINQGEWLKSVSAVVKGYSVKNGPKAGATYPPRTPELVWETIQAMWMNVFPDFRREYFRNVYSVNAGSPSYADRVARGEHIPLPCPMWYESDYQKWQEKWGDSYVKFHQEYKSTLDEWRKFH
jgi:hypothetical protein